DLALRLEFDRLLHEAEGVQILQLAAGAELLLAGLSHRNVGVAAEGAFLHVAVADADPDHERVQLACVGDGLCGAAQIGLGNDFQQRRAGPVEIDAGAVASLVQGLARVLLEMGARETNHLLAHFHLTALHDRQLVLADLVALRQVGIEVVLAGEDRARIDLAVDGETELDGALDGSAIHHRQHARQGNVDRRSLAVWRGAESGRGAGEHLAARRELRVRLDADDDFPTGAHRVSGRRKRQAPRLSMRSGSRYACEPQSSVQFSAATRTYSPTSRSVTTQRPETNCRPPLNGRCSPAAMVQRCPEGVSVERHSSDLILPASAT